MLSRSSKSLNRGCGSIYDDDKEVDNDDDEHEQAQQQA